MKLDLVALGAPALPEGMFYRIRREYFSCVVEIRLRRRVGSRPVPGALAGVQEWRHATADAAVIDACVRANHARLSHSQRSVLVNAVNAYQGDYDARGES
ncbi:hypothetical protein ACIF6L_26505 [Kitasatospora sp. NPDC086009]|uniref:hypothetical protein n=1 Tax=unclassified Kitasatospora TaxID=2633591 RepID=UPI0037CCB84C